MEKLASKLGHERWPAVK